MDKLKIYDELYSTVVGYIESDNKQALINLLESYHIKSDRGEIRTVLITLKPVIHKLPYLKDLYESVKDLLRFGSTNGII